MQTRRPALLAKIIMQAIERELKIEAEREAVGVVRSHRLGGADGGLLMLLLISLQLAQGGKLSIFGRRGHAIKVNEARPKAIRQPILKPMIAT